MNIYRNKYRKLSDETLMEYIQRYDTFAFDELYNRYSRRLLLYFFRELGGDEEKAQDFLQEIFLKLVEKPELFCTENKFSPWIFAVAYNMCKNEYRRIGVRNIIDRNEKLEELPQIFDSNCNQVEQAVDQKRFQTALIAELEKLDDDHRSAFLLKYQQNFSIKEISEIQSCSEGTIKSRLHYTTKKLA